jgi:hypothetical protein
MNNNLSFEELPVEWIGSNKLWVPPDNQLFESQSIAEISSYIQAQFIALSYTWSIEDAPHEGLVIFPANIDENASKSLWLDSWHMNNDIMTCKPKIIDKGILLVGAYPAPPGPDWGWQIMIESEAMDLLRLRMINISPEGEKSLAVEAEYEPVRKAA